MIQQKIPFDIISDQNLDELSRYRALILADQESLADRALEQIREYVRGGGGLVATGQTSLYNEWRRRRNDYGLADVLNVHLPAGRRLTPEKRGAYGRGRVAYLPAVIPADPIPGMGAEEPAGAAASPIGAVGFGRKYWKLPRNTDQIAAAIRYAAGAPFSVEFESAPLTTVMELTEKTDSSERALHWINYRLGTPAPAVTVAVRCPPGKRVTGVELLSPDRKMPDRVVFTAEGERARFTLPQLEVYTVAVLKLAP